ncbi:MAG TPA: thiamine phosphate synthase [Gammaproteobacteria bacterium]|nr:thiamine phosphate synthase [Gammaproteobacteria bacterium]
MSVQLLPRGLYAITDNKLIPPGDLTQRVSLAIAGGASVIQYRNKGPAGSADISEITSLAALCRGHGVPLIVNDDVELAAAVGAAGVHLGRDDASPEAARARLGTGAIIGISCYNDLQRARQAVQAGADYVAFGRFYPSRSKPEAVLADPELLLRATTELAIPAVAIGGITPENGKALLAAGASLLAAIHGVFGQPDTEAAARRYAMLFQAG